MSEGTPGLRLPAGLPRGRPSQILEGHAMPRSSRIQHFWEKLRDGEWKEKSAIWLHLIRIAYLNTVVSSVTALTVITLRIQAALSLSIQLHSLSFSFCSK